MARRSNAPAARTRLEHDLLGDMKIPAEAYYGVQTARAIDNFRISGVPLSQFPDLVRALAMVKMAAARANKECGVLDARRLRAIEKACQEVIDGRFLDQFPVDVFQGGAGTSTNMNANEVIANRALEHLGRTLGDYERLSPHDHVNLSQSTNDAYPTALHVATLLGNQPLMAEVGLLVKSFRAKAREFRSIVKMGRTQLQDAVPMTLGQEFAAWAASIEDELEALRAVERVMHEVNMGGTAIGTALNAPRGYGPRCVRHLARITGHPMRLATDLIEATQDTQSFVLYHAVLRSLCIKLSKVCNDLRLLSSGPRAGLGEIRLPAMQPGSSIMPGKVNPVIPEVVNQVCFKIIGNDVCVTMAAEAGQLQLNVMEPVIAQCIFEGQTLLKNAVRTLRVFCIDGIEADGQACKAFVERSIGIVTALNPIIGYDRATEIAAEALATGRGVVELVRERRWATDAQLRKALSPANLTGARV